MFIAESPQSLAGTRASAVQPPLVRLIVFSRVLSVQCTLIGFFIIARFVEGKVTELD